MGNMCISVLLAGEDNFGSFCKKFLFLLISSNKGQQVHQTCEQWLCNQNMNSLQELSSVE